jgi:hypothetical protein
MNLAAHLEHLPGRERQVEVAPPHALARLEHDHAAARFLDGVGGGQPGEPGAHDDHVVAARCGHGRARRARGAPARELRGGIRGQRRGGARERGGSEYAPPGQSLLTRAVRRAPLIPGTPLHLPDDNGGALGARMALMPALGRDRQRAAVAAADAVVHRARRDAGR